MTKSNLSKWLDGDAKHLGRRQCLACCNPEARAAIAEFHAARKDGKTAVSWADFRRHYLLPNVMKLGYDAMMNHVRNHLGGST